jgi:hypothetical protein
MKTTIKIATIAMIGISLGVQSQTEHLDGQTKLSNPGGRTLLIERNDNDSWLTFHDDGDSWYSMGIDKSNSGSFNINYGGALNSSQFVMDKTGKIGIGTANPNAKLDIRNGGQQLTFLEGSNTSGYKLGIGVNDDGVNFSNNSASRGFNFQNINGYLLKISNKGNAALYGKFEAKEIKVTNTPTADFVFEKNYNLPSLKSIEKHIKEKKHLPEIASAKEMKKNGINVGGFQIQLLQKIEELTLYTIEQEKKIKSLEKQNSKIDKQQKDIEKLEALVKQLLKDKN